MNLHDPGFGNCCRHRTPKVQATKEKIDKYHQNHKHLSVKGHYQEREDNSQRGKKYLHIIDLISV